MQFRISTLSRAAVTAASLGLLAACDKSEPVTAPKGQVLPSRASLVVEVSDAHAVSGSSVTVSVANLSSTELGALQGYLSFNPSQLRYKGQVRQSGDDQILVVNDKEAARGELRVAAIDTDGLTHTSPLVFEVISGDYASSLQFKLEEAIRNGSPVARAEATVERGYRQNAAVASSEKASRISMQEWYTLTSPSGAAAADPGEIRNGLKFGDTNFDGALTTNDGLYLINISLGLNEMIIGSDGSIVGGTGDRDAVVAGNVFPFNVDAGAPANLGEANDPTPPGRETNGQRLITVGDGLAIINESIFIDQPVVGEIIPGRPTTPVSNRIVVSSNITSNTTWTANNIYELSGGITVTNGATLTIEAGTLIEGQRGGVGLPGAAMFIARDGRINAQGTPLQPIVFTCTLASGRAKGCWGGVSILGNASSNEGTSDSPVTAGRDAVGGCKQRAAEGGAGNYGGCNDADSSGVMKYVRIEYAGFRFTPTNELNGLALYGVGNKTVIDFVQIHAGLDDGIEFFGGTVNAKHIYLTANSDDSFDYTEGWNGKVQYVIAQLDSLDSDKGFENDNNTSTPDALPRSTPTVYNVTLVGKQFVTSTSGTANNNTVGGLHVRVGAQPKYFNFLVQNFPHAIDIDNDQTCTNFNTTGFVFRNSIFAANTRIDNSDTGDPVGCGATEVDAINAGVGNTTVATSPLLSPLNVLVPDFRPSAGTATGGATPPADGFFDVSATYIGAVDPATATKNAVPWYAGWTRGWQSATTP